MARRGILFVGMKLRQTNLAKLSQSLYDVLIIGGGINGAVAAAALTARGVKTALIDKGDFAGQTSQHSSNLAWGGIKYMESYEFPLVRKLCKSRNRLIRSYPSTVQEIRFYVAHERGFRHGLLKLFLGTWLYWLIGSFFTDLRSRDGQLSLQLQERIAALSTREQIGVAALFCALALMLIAWAHPQGLIGDEVQPTSISVRAVNP